MRHIVDPKVKVIPSLPLNYEEAKNFFEDGIEYETREVYKQELKNIFLFSNGLIYNSFSLLPESAIHESFLKNYQATYSPKTIIKDILKRRIKPLPPKETYLALFDEWSSNHYHLHVDFLPRLLYFNDQELDQISLLIPDTSYFKESIQSILSLFNLRFKNIIFIKPGEILFIRKCLFISKTIVTGFAHPDLMIKLKERLVIPKDKAPISAKRIYVKRKNAFFRKVLNEQDVESFLRDSYNFEAFDFGDFPIEKQVQLAANSEIMVGMHGAGLTNIFYMPAGSKLVEFRRDGIHHNHCYWHLASALGISYSVVLGEPDDYSKVLEGPGCNLFVDIKNLKRVLDKVIS